MTTRKRTTRRRGRAKRAMAAERASAALSLSLLARGLETDPVGSLLVLALREAEARASVDEPSDPFRRPTRGRIPSRVADSELAKALCAFSNLERSRSWPNEGLRAEILRSIVDTALPETSILAGLALSSIAARQRGFAHLAVVIDAVRSVAARLVLNRANIDISMLDPPHREDDDEERSWFARWREEAEIDVADAERTLSKLVETARPYLRANRRKKLNAAEFPGLTDYPPTDARDLKHDVEAIVLGIHGAAIPSDVAKRADLLDRLWNEVDRESLVPRLAQVLAKHGPRVFGAAPAANLVAKLHAGLHAVRSRPNERQRSNDNFLMAVARAYGLDDAKAKQFGRDR